MFRSHFGPTNREGPSGHSVWIGVGGLYMVADSSHDAPGEDIEVRRGGAGRSPEDIDEYANDFVDMLLDLKLTNATVCQTCLPSMPLRRPRRMGAS